VPWYYPLEGDIMKAQTLWDSESVRSNSIPSGPVRFGFGHMLRSHRPRPRVIDRLASALFFPLPSQTSGSILHPAFVHATPPHLHAEPR
jgi:hypothetical protein